MVKLLKWVNMKKYLKKYKILYLISLIFVILYCFTTIKLSVFSKNLVDDIIMPIIESNVHDFSILEKEIFKLVIILIITFFSILIYKFLFIWIANNMNKDLNQDLFIKIENLPMAFFGKKNKGEIVSYFTNDISNVLSLIDGPIHNIFEGILLFIFSFFSMITISINLLTIYIVYLIISIFFLFEFVKKTKDPYKTLHEKIAIYNGFIKESYNGYKEINAYNYNDNIKLKLKKIIDDILKIEIFTGENTLNLANIINSIFDFLFIIIALSGMIFSYFNFKNVYLFSTSNFTAGIILSFLLLINNTKNSFIKIFAQMNRVFSAKASYERIKNLLLEPLDEKSGENINPNSINGKITYDHVTFSYETNNPIISDINIELKSGQKVGIVGTTGAGKTTIVNLLNKFYYDYEGEIYIDDINIKDIKNINEFISVVLQETYLFSDTVLENIRYGRDNATDEECIEAAKLVGADKIINMLENKYNTKLENAGASLSEGERQLIALARTALSKTKILILDEATSSIDVMTEKIVKDGLNRLMKSRTSIIIAHRLSTIEGADLIIVMKNGRILEKGTHKELIDKKGEYYELYQGNIELS